MLTNKPSMFNKQANVKSVRKVYVNIENDDVYLIWWGFDEKFEILKFTEPFCIENELKPLQWS